MAEGERFDLATGYRISRIINGGWQLSSGHGSRPSERGEAVEMLLRLADAGLTTFDGADIYGGVEEIFGALRRAWVERGGDPEAIGVHTKYVPDLDALSTLSRRDVEATIDRSLQRLGMERLDLVQFHWWDFAVHGWVEAAGWLNELRRAGKIRHLGVTNFDVLHLRPILESGVEIASNQVQYSLLDRRPERTMVDLCREHGMNLLCYGAAAGGFLAKRWQGAPPPDEEENRSLTKYRLIIEEFGGWQLYQELLEALAVVAHKHGVSVTAVALRWVLERPRVGAVIVGARHGGHLEDNLRVFNTVLDDDDREQLTAVLARARELEGDVYSVERIAGGRHAAIMKTGLNQGSP